jgi:hypothetical protein
MGQYRFNEQFLRGRDRPGSAVTLYPHAYHPTSSSPIIPYLASIPFYSASNSSLDSILAK